MYTHQRLAYANNAVARPRPAILPKQTTRTMRLRSSSIYCNAHRRPTPKPNTSTVVPASSSLHLLHHLPYLRLFPSIRHRLRPRPLPLPTSTRSTASR